MRPQGCKTAVFALLRYQLKGWKSQVNRRTVACEFYEKLCLGGDASQRRDRQQLQGLRRTTGDFAVVTGNASPRATAGKGLTLRTEADPPSN
ncbi:protein of unknown function [Hyphomicrobium sp. 1Nfss2.1]